jgi:hypothetical protein
MTPRRMPPMIRARIGTRPAGRLRFEARVIRVAIY